MPCVPEYSETMNVIWGAIKRTYTTELIATAICLIVGAAVAVMGFDDAAVPAGHSFGIGVFAILAVYRYRYGRL